MTTKSGTDTDVLRSTLVLLSALAYYGAATMHPTNDDGNAHIAVVLIRVRSMPNGTSRYGVSS
jgi:hypothetical protein